MDHSTADAPGSVSGDAALTFERVRAAERREALGLLLLGRPRGDDPAVEQFLRFAAEQHTPLDDLWLVARGGRPLAAAMLVPNPGRTGMLFVSPPAAEAHAPLARLVERLCAGLDPARFRLVQAILDPWQENEARLMEDAGLSPLATLLYMQRSTAAPERTLDLGPGLRAETWSPGSRPHFEAAILESYRDTLDCPGLVGLRGIDDILAGHRASGEFAPDLWFVYLAGDTPAAVMLLSLLPQRQGAELVYLGMAPPWRGRGLGRKLVEHALTLVRRRGATTMLLAVDDRNTPAMHLYTALGFVAHARKLVYLRAVR